LAILPGISRSGSTISIALFLGIDREIAARYSFLLSLPAIVGALALSVDASLTTASIPIREILVGTFAAFGVGTLALKVLLGLVRRGQLFSFAPYCWLVGLVALVWRFWG
jgi:undecaprenyl-diphosphatase